MIITYYEPKLDILYKKAALVIMQSINSVLKSKKNAVVGVCGGRSAASIFQALKMTKMPWKNVHFFMVDERLVPIDNNESNFKLAFDNFLKSEVPKKNIHPFVFNPEKMDKGIKDYSMQLKKLGGCYDILMLSSGEDGHIGALYPNHHSIQDDSKDFIIMDDSPKPPKDRMSISRNMLLKTEHAVILFVGKTKKEAYGKFLIDKSNFSDCPARLCHHVENTYIITDLEV
jgi:6-phosphogluconolactonase